MVILRRAPASVAEALHLDTTQQQVLDSRAPVLRVLGGPGTGKSTLAVELVVKAVQEGARADACLVLTASRSAAAELRGRVTAGVDGTSTQALARTWQAFGFAVLRAEAALRGDPPPRLLNGPEQDVILRDLLAGHAAGDAPGPSWPDSVRSALTTRGFRAELRDLLMRAVEHGLGPADLAELGHRENRPEWVAAASVLQEYDEVTAFSRHGAYDPAWVLTAAADLLEDEGQALARLHDSLDLVVVDDAQELTSAATRLLRVIVPGGPRLVLLGDPDSAVQTFRGADPRFLADGWSDLITTPGGAGGARTGPTGGSVGTAETIVLGASARLPASVAAATARVSRRIGALGGGAQRGAASRLDPGTVEVALLRSVAQEAGHIGSVLRRAHLLEGIGWHEMAVIVRGSSRASTLRRLLTSGGVPVVAAATETPLRDESAVRPLLVILQESLAIARAAATGQQYEMDPLRAADLLVSPIGGADAVGLRRLRRLLRNDELAAGGVRSSDELLAELLTDPGRAQLMGGVARAAGRVAAAIGAGVAAAPLTDDGRWAPGVSAEGVLWAVWQGSGVATLWQRAALRGGPGSARADRDLDAILALFEAAGAYVDRLPQAGPDQFVDHITGQDVPGDTLAPRAQSGAAVELMTPQSAAGRQWRIVVVAGVQEGVWPDLRLRGSVLGSEDLVDVVSGRTQSLRGAQAAVRYDETRLFHVAVSRATERLLVTAVGSEDEQPSVYLDVVDPRDGHGGGSGVASAIDDEVRAHAEVGRAMTLTGLVGELRRETVSPDPGVAEPAITLLAQAARSGVGGADPSSWWALRAVTSDRPVRDADQSVRVSPSKVEYFRQCGLRWFLTAVGGEGPSQGAATIGTLVHDIIASYSEADLPELRAQVDLQWGRLGLRPGWVTDRKRQEAHEMVERYATYRTLATTQGWSPVGVETDFQVSIGRALVSGRVDRIERDERDRLRVVDLKTGSSKPTVADLEQHGQLAAYQAAVEADAFSGLGDQSAGAALVHIGKAGLTGLRPSVQQQAPVGQSPDPEWARTLVQQTADGMAAAGFVATQGSWCKVCALKSSCPVQPEGESL